MYIPKTDKQTPKLIASEEFFIASPALERAAGASPWSGLWSDAAVKRARPLERANQRPRGMVSYRYKYKRLQAAWINSKAPGSSRTDQCKTSHVKPRSHALAKAGSFDFTSSS